jgi:hypothetical protein
MFALMRKKKTGGFYTTRCDDEVARSHNRFTTGR